MKQNRLERVIRGMEAMGLEQIIVSAPASVFYLTGTWVRPGERMLGAVRTQKRRGAAVRQPPLCPCRQCGRAFERV